MDSDSDESSDSMPQLVASSDDSDSESDAEYRPRYSQVPLRDPTIGSGTFWEGRRIVPSGHLQANDSDSDDDEPIRGWAMSSQKKNSPMKKCVFVEPEVIDLSQSDEETLIDIDTRSNEVSAEPITADDIRAGLRLNYGILITPGQTSATSGAFAMTAEHRRLITTVPTASQTVMSLDEDISPLTPLTHDTVMIPEYSARTKTTPRRILEERGLVPSTEVGLEDAKYRDCDLYSHDLRHRFIPDVDQRMTRWFRGIVCVHPRGSPALSRRSQHRCNVCLGPARCIL